MTHQDRRSPTQDPSARLKGYLILPPRQTLKGLLAQGHAETSDPEFGWVVGLAGQSGADYTAVLNQFPGTGFHAFTVSLRVPGRRALRAVFLAGPVPHASFRAALPLGSPGWGWFSVPFLQRRGAQAEAWLGIPFLSGRLVPFPSEPAPGGGGNLLGATECLGQPADAALERP